MTQMVQDGVVLAMREVIPLFVDIDTDPQKVCDEFQVRLRPTLVMADPDGKVVKRYEGEPQVPNLQQVVPEFAKKYFRDFPWAESINQALEKAKSDNKNVILYFAEESENSKQVVKTIRELKDLTEKFVFARVVFKKNSDETKKYGVSKPLSLAAIDPEKNEAIERLEGKKPAKDIKSFLEKHVRKN